MHEVFPSVTKAQWGACLSILQRRHPEWFNPARHTFCELSPPRLNGHPCGRFMTMLACLQDAVIKQGEPVPPAGESAKRLQRATPEARAHFLDGVLLDYLPPSLHTRDNFDRVHSYLQVQYPNKVPPMVCVARAAKQLLPGADQWPPLRFKPDADLAHMFASSGSTHVPPFRTAAERDRTPAHSSPRMPDYGGGARGHR